MISSIYKSSILWLAGGLTYGLIEILWRGYTHWTMVLVGGLLFLFLGGINERMSWDMPLIYQILIGATGVTIVEFVAGVIINMVFKLNVWDYSHLKFNLLGQISLIYYFLWMPVSLFGIWLDDVLRYKLFGEEKPHYTWFKKPVEEDETETP